MSSDMIIPTENDILMGRGARTRDHTGNKRFQSIVREYRERYAATRTYKQKDAVANEILARIRESNPPGRFLTDSGSSKETQNGESAEGAVWSEVADKKKIMEKIKQALREPESNKSSNRRAARVQGPKQAELAATAGMGLSHPPHALPPTAPFFGHQLLPFFHAPDPSTALHGLPAQQQHIFPSFLPGGYGVASLFGLAHSHQTEARNGSLLQGDRPDGNGSTTTQNSSAYYDDAKTEQTDDNINKKKKSREESSSTSSTISTDTSPSLAGEDLEPKEIVAARLLSSNLSEKVRQARAELEQDKEKATEEEKDQALAALFGSLCEIDQSKKRVKRTPVETEISVLLEEMKQELEAIPNFEKYALLEAQGKALQVEFSDGRMELFLLVEDLNPERAARRFVTYWNERRNLFGPDKFCLPMTLDGALRDDHACLESGAVYLAPALDASGRMVSGSIFKKGKSDKFDGQSMLRCWWFYVEVVSKHPNAKKGVARVDIVDFAGASLFDIDLALLGQSTKLKENAIPIKDRVSHFCNIPYSISVIAKPLAMLAMKRDNRLSKITHNCREEEVAESLREYGIPTHIIPKEMGGQCDFDVEHQKWLKQLRKLDTPQALDSDEFVWWEL